MRVVVTRDELVPRLEALGHEVVVCELIRIEPLGDDSIDASGYDWLVVTSRNGADELARRLIGGAREIAAVGPATADTARAHGLPVDLVPDEASQDGVLRALPRPAGRVLLA